MTPGPSTATDEDDPEAEWNETFGESTPKVRTGTALDEFLPIYQALARVTRDHGAFSPAEVDGWDITAVAAVLGLDADVAMIRDLAQWEAEYDDVVAGLNVR